MSYGTKNCLFCFRAHAIKVQQALGNEIKLFPSSCWPKGLQEKPMDDVTLTSANLGKLLPLESKGIGGILFIHSWQNRCAFCSGTDLDEKWQDVVTKGWDELLHEYHGETLLSSQYTGSSQKVPN